MPSRGREYKPGERLAGTVYEVVRLIGSGGMGTVYDVEDTSIGKRYVLKTLHPQLGAREDVARRMRKEARTLARLNHSNIVEVITAGVTGDELRLPYYVMERLNGQSLRVVLEKKGRLELPHAYHIGIDLLDALDHAHDKGVIHRDVKPDNIFLHRTSAGVTVTKLLDFGILSLLDASVRDTGSRFLGTLRYAAPEQLRGEKPTAKVDLYAAGLVLYEILAGCGPFDDEPDPHAVGAAHLHKPAPALSSFVSVAPELEALVMSALAKEPDARPRDAFSFAADLRRFKRAQLVRPRESTEDRATAAAVIGAESAPFVDVRVPSSDGPYVISPARDARPPNQTSFPRTTVRGVTARSLPAPLGGPDTGAPTVTTPDAIDRSATTNSLAPDTIASPKHGTVAFELGPRDRSAIAAPLAPASVGDAHLQWPDERTSATSEARQVQTLSVAAPGSLRSTVRLAGVAAFGVLVLAGILLFVWRPFAKGPREAVAAGEAATRTPTPLRTGSAAVAATPASAWAPGEPLAPGPSALAGQEGEPASLSPAPIPVRPKPRAAASASAKPRPPAVRADRPGPGF
ncbi:MAG: protein kinase [Polyangiaceae bacterium]